MGTAAQGSLDVSNTEYYLGMYIDICTYTLSTQGTDNGQGRTPPTRPPRAILNIQQDIT